MCLIALSLRASSFPLVLAANRDEDYERPTLPAAFWADAPDVLGGRDGLLGGTWLAITRSGRFAAVTNLRGTPRDPRKRSRGELVSEFVRGGANARDYINDVASRVDQYAAFHLIAGDRDGVVELSGGVRVLADGIHSLSNAPAGERWPKMNTAESQMKRMSHIADADELVDALLEFLSTPLGIDDRESEVFVAGERYGTRSSTAIVIARDRVYFAEQSFARGGKREGLARRFSFALE